jgi:anti-sigma regulatory factor (Ser/Thr protein kinase)
MLRLTGPALATQLSRVRSQVAAWATSMGMNGDAVDDLVLATHEALANVVDHAYPGGSGVATVKAERSAPDELLVSVSDRGHWRKPPADPGRRGHGLTIIARLAKHVEVRRGEGGTTVAMWWALDGPRQPPAAAH